MKQEAQRVATESAPVGSDFDAAASSLAQHGFVCETMAHQDRDDAASGRLFDKHVLCQKHQSGFPCAMYSQIVVGTVNNKVSEVSVSTGSVCL
jgi:hypothetical protein